MSDYKLLVALKNVMVRLGLMLGGIVLAVLLLEMLLRVAYPITVYFAPDTLLGHTLTPGLEGWRSSVGEFRIRYRINSEGLRGPQIPYEKPDDRIRILVLGDSVTAALEVTEAETTVSRLEQILNQNSNTQTFEVINAGRPAYTTAQEVIYLENEGLKYEPDLVIVIFFTPNDITHNGNYAHIDWTQDNPIDEGDVAGAGTLPADYVASLGEARPRSRLVVIISSTLRRSQFLTKILVGSQDYVHPIHDIYSPEVVDAVEIGWEVTAETFKRLKRLGEENGIPVMVVIWPGPLDYNDIWWDGMVAAFPLMANYDRSQPSQRAAALLEEIEIPSISLLPVFDDAWSQVGERNYLNFPKDEHPTAEAHNMAAQALAQYLQDSGILGFITSASSSDEPLNAN